jgi:ABC-type glutathione transport system ATPase component
MSATTLLEIDGVSRAFRPSRGIRRGTRGRRPIKALDNVSLAIARHETVALVGESGSGKSTLARVIVRLVRADEGRVLLDGEDILTMDRKRLAATRPRIQMIFQDPYSSLNPRRTVQAAIAEPARVHDTLDNATEDHFVAELLEQVGLSKKTAARLPRELSGGQRQRVAIARALAIRPEVLIADEAVSALDVSVQAQILNLFANLRAELGLTMLFISHQLPVVAHIADWAAVMQRGKILEYGRPSELFAHPTHPYTAELVEAQPGRRHREQ